MTRVAALAARLSGAWQARQPRERMMLAVMATALAAFAYWYGGMVPLRHLAASAKADHARAAATLAGVRGNLAALAAARTGTEAPPDPGAHGAAILDAAGEAGVVVSRQAPRAGGGVAVGIDATDAVALFAWLEALRTRYGIVPESLNVGRRDGHLHVEAAFAGPQPD